MTHLLPFKISTVVLLLAGIGLAGSCNKKDFLDKKPNTNLVIPSTLEDFQALLDYDAVMRETPALGELSADNYYLPYFFWLTVDTKEQNAYSWAVDTYAGQGGVDDWNLPYKQVFYANTVMEGLAKLALDTGNELNWKVLQGSALFIRAYAFYNIAQIFAPIYDKMTAAADPGIPLRLSSDVSAVSFRSSLKQTYDQILSDLQQAIALLPSEIPYSYRNRPSKPAAMALLARIYLSMREYGHAGAYADSSLQLYNTLIDYNTVSNTLVPFERLNAETMYQSRLLSSTQVLIGIVVSNCVVDSNLFRSYAAGDLRRSVFYTINSSGQPNAKGSYNNSLYPFTGLATDEMYLVRAECYARAGNIAGALNDLNTLLKYRWQSGSFALLTAFSAAEALHIVLTERRKELPFRGLRWSDLRRLNKEGAGITLMRRLNDSLYKLAPNDLRYVLPIPPDVISMTGMTQNKRQ
jgi:hypothetical protein